MCLLDESIIDRDKKRITCQKSEMFFYVVHAQHFVVWYTLCHVVITLLSEFLTSTATCYYYYVIHFSGLNLSNSKL